jgi:hypothetical protein
MKGPYERLKFDLRRVWECPICKRRERTAGTVTFRHCNCRMKQVDGQPVVMKLVEDGVQRHSAPITAKREESEPPTVPATPSPENTSAPMDPECGASLQDPSV